MTQLSDLFNPIDLQSEIAAGYVKATSHPSLPLTIFTYTREAQYEGRWNDVTIKCRGLIADHKAEVMARSFDKFWSVGEAGVRDYAPPLPLEPFRVYSKLDGSLGIIFYYQDAWRAASKGSFVSEQAMWAQDRLDREPWRTANMDRELTYSTEILYPENRIVVNYGDRQELTLLAAFRTDGTEVPLTQLEPHWRLGDVVASHDGGSYATDLTRIIEHTAENKHLDGTDATGTDAEGYVIRFKSGVRAKSKFAEYIRLHRILTGITERDIWRAYAFDDMADLDLSDEALVRALKCSPGEVAAMRAAPLGAVATIVEGVPDEFDEWTKSVMVKLQRAYDQIDLGAHTIFDVIVMKAGVSDRGAFARELQKWYGDRKTLVSCCFAMLDKKPLAPLVWRSLYPAASTPFREDEGS